MSTDRHISALASNSRAVPACSRPRSYSENTTKTAVSIFLLAGRGGSAARQAVIRHLSWRDEADRLCVDGAMGAGIKLPLKSRLTGERANRSCHVAGNKLLSEISESLPGK